MVGNELVVTLTVTRHHSGSMDDSRGKVCSVLWCVLLLSLHNQCSVVLIWHIFLSYTLCFHPKSVDRSVSVLFYVDQTSLGNVRSVVLDFIH
jgi:hypothetical protein